MPVIISKFPPQWVPEVVILEGMFLIQIPPIPTMGGMKDYVNLLLTKSVRPHLKAGVIEVHVVFDNPGSLSETPKEIEHRRRDMAQQKSTHECVQFFSHTCITGSWRTLLSCRACKKAFINYVAEEMLRIVPSSLYGNQLFTTNISNTAYSVSSNRIVTPEPTLRSNADEGDLRVWLHCVNTRGQRKLIFSPDTDVYTTLACS